MKGPMDGATTTTTSSHRDNKNNNNGKGRSVVVFACCVAHQLYVLAFSNLPTRHDIVRRAWYKQMKVRHSTERRQDWFGSQQRPHWRFVVSRQEKGRNLHGIGGYRPNEANDEVFVCAVTAEDEALNGCGSQLPFLSVMVNPTKCCRTNCCSCCLFWESGKNAKAHRLFFLDGESPGRSMPNTLTLTLTHTHGHTKKQTIQLCCALPNSTRKKRIRSRPGHGCGWNSINSPSVFPTPTTDATTQYTTNSSSPSPHRFFPRIPSRRCPRHGVNVLHGRQVDCDSLFETIHKVVRIVPIKDHGWLDDQHIVV